MRELIEKRTATAKHFDLDNGIYRLEAHIGQIHYRDGALKDGAFREIDTTLEYYEASRGFGVTRASYEAQIGLYGDVRFFNVDHSLEFRLPNPNRIEAEPYAGSEFGRLQKALIWRDILQPGGHQIVEARNSSLVKLFRFEQKPLSNVIEFQAIASAGVKFSDGTSDFDLTKEVGRSIKGRQGLFHSDGRLSWIRQPRAWNHRGEVVDVELQFFRRGNQIWLRKVIPQDFIDHTFDEAGAWLETDLTTSFYVGSGDGYYYRYVGTETWAVIRAGAETGNMLASDSSLTGLKSHLSNSARYIEDYRAVSPVDTSGLGSSASISSATLNFYGISKLNGLGSSNLTLDRYTSLGFAIANYVAERQAIDIAYASFNTSAWNAWSLNATGLGNIDKVGTTKLALRYTYDVDNTTPTWAANSQTNFQFRTSEYTGTDYDPYLSVVYQLEFYFFNRNQISKPHYRM
jgi:hypothetical protein